MPSSLSYGHRKCPKKVTRVTKDLLGSFCATIVATKKNTTVCDGFVRPWPGDSVYLAVFYGKSSGCANRAFCFGVKVVAVTMLTLNRRPYMLRVCFWRNIMAVRIELPEDIEHHLETKWGNLPRHALEALAMAGYRARVLSRSQVRRMLGFETGAEVDEFMKRAGVPIDYTLNDFEHDGETSRYLRETRNKELQGR
jgi:hypothetical protein